MNFNQTKKNIITIAAMMAISVALIAVSYFVKNHHRAVQKDEYVQYDFVMGTAMTQTLYPTAKGDAENLAALAEELAGEVEQLDSDVISWRNESSELAGLNQNYKAGQHYRVSDTLYQITEKSLDICESTGGALDITLRPLANVWGIEDYNQETDGEFQVPTEEKLQQAAENIGYEAVSTGTEGEEAPWIQIEREDRMLDFGATGKGYALDKIYERLQDREELGGCVIAVGGSILVSGTKTDGTDFKVGIRNPWGSENDVMGYIQIPAGTEKICISTSGNYEKYVMADGRRYHHILDRTTLAPAESGIVSVTVYCEDGLYSDGLSTACFVLGYEASRPILEQYHAEAIFIDEDNQVYVTDGLKERFVTVDSEFTLAEGNGE